MRFNIILNNNYCIISFEIEIELLHDQNEYY